MSNEQQLRVEEVEQARREGVAVNKQAEVLLQVLLVLTLSIK